jgi:peptidoglycan/xylan/chitin deacetylase (PgdA/CDA1 family)
MKLIRVLFAMGLALSMSSPDAITAIPQGRQSREGPRPGQVSVPILLYHRLGRAVPDEMWVRDATFAWQLRYLKGHGYTVIPLRVLVDYFRGKGPPPPARAVVITADDGHRSVFTDMQPLVKEYRVPVTLFIYPSAISRASYAMTWSELAALVHTGLFEVESHTYWHPNFDREKARLTPPEYAAFVHVQLANSKEVLERRLGIHVDMLAWPFGICDDDLMARAAAAGYIAAFTIERKPASELDRLMALPRYIVTDRDRGAAFARLLGEQALTLKRPAPARARRAPAPTG